MTRHWSHSFAGCCLAVSLFVFGIRAQTPPQTPPASTTPADVKAQIDALLKKANDQMQVTAQLKDAEDNARAALELSRKAGDQARIMRSLYAIGSVYFYVGRFAEALDLGQECIDLAKAIGDKQSLSVAYNGRASVLRALGRYEDAVADYDKSAAIARELNDLPLQWTLARNVGVLYSEMGDLDRAEAPLKDALRIAGELGAPQWKTRVPDGGKVAHSASLETLGTWEYGREHYQQAADYLEQALAANPGVPAFVAEILTNLALARQSLGQADKAVDLMQQALTTWASTGAPPHPLMLADLASAQEAAGSLEDARAGDQRALTLVRENGGNPQYDWLIESRLAHVERQLKHNDAALADYLHATHTIEELRASALATETGRAFTLSARRRVFDEAADLLHDQGRDAEALSLTERGRARAFLDVLVESRTGLSESLTSDQRAREDAIFTRIAASQKAQWASSASAADRRTAEASVAAAEQDLDAFHRELRRTDPRYASLQYPDPAGVDRVQSDLLDASTTLVEYSLGEKRSLAWVVRKERVTAIELPPRKQIDALIDAFLTRLHAPVSTLTLRQSLDDVGDAGLALYGAIYRPLEQAIGSAARLIVIPDAGLNYVPFEALVTARTRSAAGPSLAFLTEKVAIVYGPSASALVSVRALNRQPRQPSKTLLAFGDPVSTIARERTEPAPASFDERGFSLARLPFAREEVLAIGALFPAADRRILLGADAREETVKTTPLDDYRYLHFASHGFLDEMKPGRSGIVLSRGATSSEDGMLQVPEIMRLKLNADLVTLSACSTGLGKLINGEGVLGLTRAIFYAGARNVAVSLWNVNDSATATLMTSLYRDMKRGRPAAEALRQAQLALVKGSNRLWQHPYFWAAFVIEGEGR